MASLYQGMSTTPQMGDVELAGQIELQELTRLLLIRQDAPHANGTQWLLAQPAVFGFKVLKPNQRDRDVRGLHFALVVEALINFHPLGDDTLTTEARLMRAAACANGGVHVLWQALVGDCQRAEARAAAAAAQRQRERDDAQEAGSEALRSFEEQQLALRRERNLKRCAHHANALEDGKAWGVFSSTKLGSPDDKSRQAEFCEKTKYVPPPLPALMTDVPLAPTFALDIDIFDAVIPTLPKHRMGVPCPSIEWEASHTARTSGSWTSTTMAGACTYSGFWQTRKQGG